MAEIKSGDRYYHYMYGEMVVTKVEGDYVSLTPSEHNDFYGRVLKIGELLFNVSSFETTSNTGKGCILFLSPEGAVKSFVESPDACHFETNGSQGQWPKALSVGAFDDFDVLYKNASVEGKKKLANFGKPDQKDSSQLPLIYQVISIEKLKRYIEVCKAEKTDEDNPYFYSDKYLPKNEQDAKRVWIEDKLSINPIYYCPVLDGKSLLEVVANQYDKAGYKDDAKNVRDILEKLVNIAESFGQKVNKGK